MLRELRVKNFAIVEDGLLSFEKGMSAFTGETGAGKSLLLDAITLLLGVKARSDLVRTGSKSAEVEGVFDLTRDPDKLAMAAQLGFEVDADEAGLLFVRREISQDVSKSRVWIQGRSATRKQLQELLGDWVEVSGQHEFLKLGQEGYILGLVDQYGGLREELREVRELYAEYQVLKKQFEASENREGQRESRTDYLKFLIEEFDRAGISAESEREEETLVALRARLGSLEKIRVALEAARSLIDGGDSENGAGCLSQIQAVVRELRPFQNFGEDLSESVQMSDEAAGQLQELSKRVGRILSSLEADPAALENAETRLSNINRLKRKHNADVVGLVKLYSDARAELEELNNSEGGLEKLRARLERQDKVLRSAAQKLHTRRVQAAGALERSWEKDVRVLGMAQARLKLAISEWDAVGPTGLTRIEALFSANPGESPKSLGKIASGGELSRIMLALKNLVAGRSEIGVYLFDEVDAGIGGETAQLVGARLRKLAEDNQVLVVTHLAQIAAKSHYQFSIHKATERGRTRTLIEALDSKGREAEVARMLGDMGSKAALTLARELLRTASAPKRGREAGLSA